MLLLFAISVASFVALIGVVVAIVRHIRSGHRRVQSAAPPEPTFVQHLYAASEYGSVRSPRQIRDQTVEAVTARKTWTAPSQPAEIDPAVKDAGVADKRKTPQTAGTQRAEFAAKRTDSSYFNKNYSGLRDPHSSRPARVTSDGTAAPRRRY